MIRIETILPGSTVYSTSTFSRDFNTICNPQNRGKCSADNPDWRCREGFLQEMMPE